MQQWAFEHISSAQADDNNIQMMLLRHLLEYQQWVHKGKEFIYFKNRIDVNIKLKPQMIAWYQEQLQHPGSSRLIGSIQPNFQWIKWTNVKYVNNPSVRLIIMTNGLLITRPTSIESSVRQPHWPMVNRNYREQNVNQPTHTYHDHYIMFFHYSTSQQWEWNSCTGIWPEIAMRIPYPRQCIHDNEKEFLDLEFQEMPSSYGI